MYDWKKQWLFMVTDTNIDSGLTAPEFMSAGDGYNIGVMFNSSNNQPGVVCAEGLLCAVEEVLRAYGAAAEFDMSNMMEDFDGLNDEEWDLLRPTQAQISNNVMAEFMSNIVENGQCGNCSKWEMSAVEYMGPGIVNMIDVGSWSHTHGLVSRDQLFPHVSGGYRGRVLRVAAIENFPWTILTSPGSPKGISFELLDVLGDRLNFTYAVETPKTQTDDAMIDMVVNNEVDFTASVILMTEPRRSRVQFTNPVRTEEYSIMYRRPGEIPKITLFVEPFTPFVSSPY